MMRVKPNDWSSFFGCFIDSTSTRLRLQRQQSKLWRRRQRRRRRWRSGCWRWRGQSRRRRRQQHGPYQLHYKTANRTGERVPLQQIPDEGAADRDCRRSPTQRNAGPFRDPNRIIVSFIFVSAIHYIIEFNWKGNTVHLIESTGLALLSIFHFNIGLMVVSDDENLVSEQKLISQF